MLQSEVTSMQHHGGIVT